jgi:ABC-type molybdenum transport system ATPase subunit/photorepair protein PhrA
MIQLITGNKGTGKTKAIIDIANDHVETAKGDIVFLTDTDRYMYSLRYQIRAINTSDLKRGTEPNVREDMLVGYIYGVLAGNHDIESMYIDGAHRMLGKDVSEMEHFFMDLEEIAEKTDTKFIVTVSQEDEELPAFLNKYTA